MITVSDTFLAEVVSTCLNVDRISREFWSVASHRLLHSFDPQVWFYQNVVTFFFTVFAYILVGLTRMTTPEWFCKEILTCMAFCKQLLTYYWLTNTLNHWRKACLSEWEINAIAWIAKFQVIVKSWALLCTVYYRCQFVTNNASVSKRDLHVHLFSKRKGCCVWCTSNFSKLTLEKV